ncbi:unnamed protein product [Sphenostylis stenocarpa]|uniref:Cupin type-1 domain-containing protein n=1 Tax=Sphenostylis stenocarpa TaxID=92480 RepID=A0AA86VZQ4_9FABA|nr:unnamed protein product [Sphenostylis stenocarpa]
MTRLFTLSLSCLCVLLLASACFGSIGTQRFNQCQLDSLNVLEPDHRVECEGGIIETWSPKHPELKCAGVTFSKRTLYTNGLHMPSYSPYTQMIMIVQGKGAIGFAMPGCPAMFEEPADQSGSSSQKTPSDSHQKIRQFKQGHMLMIPAGVPYWTYNTGDEPLVAISLLDTSSIDNQLDKRPRVFYLAGNPDIEHPLAIKAQQVEEEGGNVLSGFSKGFLAKSLNIDEDIAEKLLSPEDEMKQIVKLEQGLSVISPKWQDEDEDDDDEDEDESYCQPPRRPTHGKRVHKVEVKEVEPLPPRKHVHEEEVKEVEPLPSRKHVHEKEVKEVEPLPPRKHVHEEEVKEVEPLPHHKHVYEDEDEDEYKPRSPRSPRTRGPTPSPRGEGHKDVDEGYDESARYKTHHEKSWTEPAQEVESGESIKQWETRQSKDKPHGSNGVDETLCTLKLVHNIARPSSADFYNPKAGRINNLNSLTLPALYNFGLSAQYVVLYKNGIYAPHWNLNANSAMYGIRGRGQVKVVNSEGMTVFDGELGKGQLLVVPQNFMVAEEAGEEGFEYVVFKTNHNAVTSYLKETFRAFPSEVLANIYKIPQTQVSDLKYNGNRGPLVNGDQSQYQSS